MPTNLPPEYFEVEKRYKAASTPAEQARLLEELLGTIPKHKGTDHLRADLRRKLSKLKEQARSKKGASRQASLFRVEREGAGQAVVVGPANTGKSALVAALTNATPEVSPYPYTTWTPTPGMMTFENVQIQLIDTPPLDREYVEPELVDLIRRADLILLVVDLQTYPIQQLEDTVALLEGQRIVPRQREGEYEGLGRVTAIPLLVVVNKNDDQGTDEDFEVLHELLGDEWPLLPVSAETGRNLDALRQVVYEWLGLIRVYAKPPGREPDLSRPFVLERGSTVEDFAGKVHQDFLENLKSARVWGSGVFEGQPVSRDYVLHEGDVVELRI
jgi:ribosome-interacting GTPase 1